MGKNMESDCIGSAEVIDGIGKGFRMPDIFGDRFGKQTGLVCKRVDRGAFDAYADLPDSEFFPDGQGELLSGKRLLIIQQRFLQEDGHVDSLLAGNMAGKEFADGSDGLIDPAVIE